MSAVQYSETQIVAAVASLTRAKLSAFVAAEIVTPVQTEAGPAYRQIDRVRLELLCELSDGFDLDEDALGVIISLIDQLHGVRSDLRAVLAAVEREDEAVRRRIARALIETARPG
jgi:chaperone modulatory protein CbpM